ncbi:MAG TPA: protoporphyrinogen oxidase [Caldilineaceae bacterium]|nr:protoporphyrinogen oxidase [Caldilineaceae bacterium]
MTQHTGNISPTPSGPSNAGAPLRASAAGHILILGGGIAGLSAAWELEHLGLRYTLVEAAPRLGGMIQSARFEGFVAEGGPETFITRKPELWNLAHEVGLAASLVPIRSETSGAAVLHNGKVMHVPLSPLLFVTSPLLSWRGKLRMMAEPFIPARTDDVDETLAAFAQRRLGQEASDRLIAPILSGIYNSDAERQSIMTTASVMRELEKHGSLIRGTLATMRHRRAEQRAGGAVRPRSVSFANGAQELVDRLAQQLTGTLLLNTQLTDLAKHKGGYIATTAAGDTIAVDAVILAIPASAAAALLGDLSPTAVQLLNQIRFASIGTVALGFRRAAMREAPPVSSLMIPRRARRRIDAVLWRPDRAPADHTLLRVFFGGGDPALLDLDDAALLAAVRDELRDLLQITDAPVAHRVFRWPHGFPQADVGHLSLIDRIEAALPPTIALAGNSYRGIGVPDCVRQGRMAAQRVAAVVAAQASTD